MSPNLKSVEMAGVLAIKQKSKPYLIQTSQFFEPVDRLKSSFSKLVNAQDKDRIAIVPSASYGLANAAMNISAPEGSKIIIPQEQFPSNYYVWEKIARQKKYNLEITKAPSSRNGRGREWNEAIIDAIDERTAVVACAHVHWADGSKFDLVRIRERCDHYGAMLVIDGTQSVGALPFDIQEIRPDALICAGYKWLFGPYGIGFAYYSEAFDHGQPIEENWINRLHSENFKELVNYQSEYKAKAHRYCVGENSNFVNTPMMQTALDQIIAWGVDNIQDYSKQLVSPYLKAFMDMGFAIEEEAYRSNHLLGLAAPVDFDLENLSGKLKQANIHVSARGSSIRLATSVYNNKRDLDQFYAILHKEYAII